MYREKMFVISHSSSGKRGLRARPCEIAWPVLGLCDGDEFMPVFCGRIAWNEVDMATTLATGFVKRGSMMLPTVAKVNVQEKYKYQKCGFRDEVIRQEMPQE